MVMCMFLVAFFAFELTVLARSTDPFLGLGEKANTGANVLKIFGSLAFGGGCCPLWSMHSNAFLTPEVLTRG